MSGTDWQAITEKLRAAGFRVSYARICYEPTNPFWRADASREGRMWSGLWKAVQRKLLHPWLHISAGPSGLPWLHPPATGRRQSGEMVL